MSEWRKIWTNGLPIAGRLPKSCYRMAPKGIQLPWRWDRGMFPTKLDVIWGMSAMSQDMIYTASDYETQPSGIKIKDKVLQIIQGLEVESILDVGCGNGRFGEILRRSGYHYVGLEPDETQLAFLRRTHPHLDVVQASCYDGAADLDLGHFDLVISIEVIEHLYYPGRLLAFKKNFVKPGGTILTTTPDHGNYMKNLAIALLGRWDAQHDVNWVGGHIKFFSRKSLGELHEKVGLKDLRWDSVAGYRMPLLPMTIVCLARP